MATLTQLRTTTRRKADEENTSFIIDAELTGYLNQGLRLVYGKIVEAYQDHFIVPGTTGNTGKFSTTSGTQAYAFPTTLQKLIRVEHRRSGSTDDNEWKKMSRLNIGNDRLDEFFPIREGYNPGFGYFVAGTSLYLRPVPDSTFEIRLWFIPRVTALSGDSDVPGVPEEYHDLIAEYAAIQCLAKSGEGIYKERMDAFNIELDAMLSTIQHRDYQPEQMIITDDSDFERNILA